MAEAVEPPTIRGSPPRTWTPRELFPLTYLYRYIYIFLLYLSRIWKSTWARWLLYWYDKWKHSETCTLAIFTRIHASGKAVNRHQKRGAAACTMCRLLLPHPSFFHVLLVSYSRATVDHDATVHSKRLTHPSPVPLLHRHRTLRVWSRPVARRAALRTLRTRFYALDS